MSWFDSLWILHTFSFATAYTVSITYWLHMSNEFYIFVSTSFDLIVDISEAYGSWMAILEITVLTATTMTIIQQITVYFTQSNINTVNFTTNIMGNNLVMDYYFTSYFTLKKLFLRL